MQFASEAVRQSHEKCMINQQLCTPIFSHADYLLALRRCHTCQECYRECDNIGSHACRVHPASYDRTRGMYRCCGNPAPHAPGCYSADHTEKDAAGLVHDVDRMFIFVPIKYQNEGPARVTFNAKSLVYTREAIPPSTNTPGEILTVVTPEMLAAAEAPVRYPVTADARRRVVFGTNQSGGGSVHVGGERRVIVPRDMIARQFLMCRDKTAGAPSDNDVAYGVTLAMLSIAHQGMDFFASERNDYTHVAFEPFCIVQRIAPYMDRAFDIDTAARISRR